MAWVKCTSGKAPLMLNDTVHHFKVVKLMYRCWSIICCHPGDVFFRDVPAYFSKTMPNHIQHVLQQRGFVVKGCGYLTGLPAVQTCLPLRMCGTLRMCDTVYIVAVRWKPYSIYLTNLLSPAQNTTTETPDC